MESKTETKLNFFIGWKISSVRKEKGKSKGEDRQMIIYREFMS